jgi:hypothetical protein
MFHFPRFTIESWLSWLLLMLNFTKLVVWGRRLCFVQSILYIKCLNINSPFFDKKNVSLNKKFSRSCRDAVVIIYLTFKFSKSLSTGINMFFIYATNWFNTWFNTGFSPVFLLKRNHGINAFSKMLFSLGLSVEGSASDSGFHNGSRVRLRTKPTK